MKVENYQPDRTFGSSNWIAYSRAVPPPSLFTTSNGHPACTNHCTNFKHEMLWLQIMLTTAYSPAFNE
jgi:hypothetical protein